jgi:hypothetical protein
LRAAIAEVDAFFAELAKHTKIDLRYAGDTEADDQIAA